jgi:hypothetical protein
MLERSILHKIKRKKANCWSHLAYELPPKTRYEGKIKKGREYEEEEVSSC